MQPEVSITNDGTLNVCPQGSIGFLIMITSISKNDRNMLTKIQHMVKVAPAAKVYNRNYFNPVTHPIFYS